MNCFEHVNHTQQVVRGKADVAGTAVDDGLLGARDDKYVSNGSFT